MWHTSSCVLHFEWDVCVVTLTACLSLSLSSVSSFSPSPSQPVMHVASRVYFQPSCGHWADVCVILLLPGRRLKLGPQRAYECLLDLFKNKYKLRLESLVCASGSRAQLKRSLCVGCGTFSALMSLGSLAINSNTILFIHFWGLIFLIFGFFTHSRHQSRCLHIPVSLKAPWETLVQGRFLIQFPLINSIDRLIEATPFSALSWSLQAPYDAHC